MNERVVVPSAGIQFSSLAPPHIVEVTKPGRGQAITVELRDRHGTVLDFSGLAHEKLKLVQAGAKLVVEFDNQSTVTAEPFFDLSSKPFPYIDVELGGGRETNSEQFSALLSQTVGQSAQPDADKSPPSAPDFVDPSIDALPNSSLPLALLGQEGQRALPDADGDGAAPHLLLFSGPTIIGSAPGNIAIPPPGGAATQVFESGLLARGSEPAGTHAGNPAFPTTTKAGTIGFTSNDGVQSVSLGGHVLSATQQTFTDATGSLTASYNFNTTTHRGTISYTWPHSESLRVVCSEDGRVFRRPSSKRQTLARFRSGALKRGDARAVVLWAAVGIGCKVADWADSHSGEILCRRARTA